MSVWAFRSLLWFIAILFIQPQNRFPFLHPMHIADITAIGAVLLHAVSSQSEGKPLIRMGPGTIMASLVLVFCMLSQYTGIYQSSTAWNLNVDFVVKACVILILIEAMATSIQRVWAVQATLMLCVLWWLKAGFRLSSAGATYAGDRIMGAAVSIIENPNSFAFFLSAYIPLYFFFYRTLKVRWAKISMLIAIPLCVFIILQTGSRTGIVILAVMVLLALPKLAGKERKALIFGALAMFVVMNFVAQGNIDRFKTITTSLDAFLSGKSLESVNVDEASAVERALRMKYTRLMIIRHPFGIGMNPDPDLYPDELAFAAGKAHNELLMSGRQMGIQGMILYLGLLFMPLFRGWKMQKTFKVSWPEVSELGWMFKIQACVFLIGGMFSPSPFNYPHMIMAGSCSALWLTLKEQGRV